ncbi:MAG: Oxygen regulatory protein NreC [Syntrophorhabdaceae bacterium PtaU1.Bin034]|nr:MAG: Oxygen regulatory protein NreC [Syntrophorhabdaceae bacterium PtaU1.Bin034]
MGTINIVLADDHLIVRQGVKALLENQPGFSVVGEASDGLKAVDVTMRTKPHVLVVDLMMPGFNGIEVTRQVSKLSPGTKVIILSMYMNEPYVIEALRNGAYGYVLKESAISDLVNAIQRVITGHHYLGPTLSERAIEAYLEKKQDTSLDPYDTLTSREREVLHLAAEGCSNPEIAGKLFISPRTAETHRANMMRKLGVHTQTDLIKYALKKGIIPKEE